MKTGIRVMGVVETSPVFGRSMLCGVVTARFMLEDVAVSFITLGGTDATEGLLELYELLKRPDLKLALLSGRIVAGYNVIDVVRFHELTGLPVVALPYLRPKKRVSEIIRRLFGEDERLEVYRKVKQYAVPLRVGRPRVAIVVGIDPSEAEAFLNRILVGRTPFPIYVADRIARGLRRSFERVKF